MLRSQTESGLLNHFQKLNPEKISSLFCAADFFADYWEPSARTCLSYAVFQILNEGVSEFSRHRWAAKMAATKKAARRVCFLKLLFFGEAKK
ncbi:MAG: hypothetical protein WCE88_05540 [Burkholderiales bacterium]